VVLVIGELAATALSKLVRAGTSQAGFSKPVAPAKFAFVADWALRSARVAKRTQALQAG
jgi:hypothetical protein